MSDDDFKIGPVPIFTGGGGGGAVDSVFGRTGTVTAQSGDYDATLVSYASNPRLPVSNVDDAIDQLALSIGVGEVAVVNATTQSVVRYSTIAAAIAAAVPASGDEVVVGPGQWAEAITMTTGLKLRGTQQGTVQIQGVGAVPSITMADQSIVSHVQVVCNSGVPGVRFTGAASTEVAHISKCSCVGLGGTAMLHANGPGRLVGQETQMLGGTLTSLVHVDGGVVDLVRVEIAGGTVTNFMLVENGGVLDMLNCSVDAAPASISVTNGLTIDDSGSVAHLKDATFLQVTNGVNFLADGVEVTLLNAWIDATGDPVLVAGGLTGTGTVFRNIWPYVEASPSSLNIDPSWLANSDIFFITANDAGLDREARLVGMELNVGRPEAPAESNFGEGDSYALGMLVYTETAGGVFTDVTEDMKDSTTTTALPGTAVDNAFYFGSAARDSSDNPHKFGGIKVDVATAAVYGAGELLCEIWNGAAWVTINNMSVRDANPVGLGPEVLSRAQTEQVYLNYDDVDSVWQTNDPVSLGVNLYWMRIRVDTAITTAPELRTSKLHSNRSNFGEDGFEQWFGTARQVGELSFDLGLLEAANNSPANQDVYPSDTLGLGRVENAYAAGAIDRQVGCFVLPANIDTSSPLQLRFYYVVNDATAGDVIINIRSAVASVGDDIFLNTADAPTDAPGQVNTQFVEAIAVNTENTILLFETTIDISNVIAIEEGGAPNLLFIGFEREGTAVADDYIGTLNLIQFAPPKFRRWCPGGFII